MSANLKSEGTMAEQIDLRSQESKDKLLRMRQYQRQELFIFTIEIGILFLVFISLYFFGFRSFSEIEAMLNPRSNLYTYIGMSMAIIISITYILSYPSWAKAWNLKNELHLSGELFMKHLWSPIIFIISALCVCVFYLYLGSLDSTMFWIILFGIVYSNFLYFLNQINKQIKQLLSETDKKT